MAAATTTDNGDVTMIHFSSDPGPGREYTVDIDTL